MKYKAVLLFVFVFGITIAQSKESFADIYSKNVNARGGAEIAHSMKTCIYGGELIREDSISFYFRIAYKSPNKMIVEYYHEGDTIAVGYNGVKGWTLMPRIAFQAIELPASAIDEATTLTINPILKYFNRLDLYTNSKSQIKISNKRLGDTVEQYTLICRTNKNNAEESISINQTDWLVSRVNTMMNLFGETVPASVAISNYRMIDSTMIPFHVKITSGNSSIVEVKLSYMEINPELEDIIFEMPK